MDMGVIRGVITIISMATFLGICWWAYRSGNRERFEQDALLPFADDPGLASAEASRAPAALSSSSPTSTGNAGAPRDSGDREK